MQTIADRLPDAKVYEQVYADGILGIMLVEAYRNVLVFAKGATEYFQGRALREWHALRTALDLILTAAQGEC
jgi:hypothetical protein